MSRGPETMPDEGRLRELLVGRSVVAAERTKYGDGQLTLDDGTVLLLGGNEGCGGCPSGFYELTELAACENAITNVEVEGLPDGEDSGAYRVFVFSADGRINLATFEGDDGNGYYGTGWWLQVISGPAE